LRLFIEKKNVGRLPGYLPDAHPIDGRRDPDQVLLESSFASPSHDQGEALHFLQLERWQLPAIATRQWVISPMR